MTSALPRRAEEALGVPLPEVEIGLLGEAPRQIRPTPCASWQDKGDKLIRIWVRVGPYEHLDELVSAEDADSVVVLAHVGSPRSGELGPVHTEPYLIHLERPVGRRLVIDGHTGVVLFPDR